MAFEDAKNLSSEEKVLWACVLRRAVFDYVLYKGSGKNRLQWKRAYNFLFGNEQSEEGLRFEDICGLFGWEPDYLRRLAQRLSKEDIKKIYAASVKEDYLDVVQTKSSQKVLGRTQASIFIASYNELFNTEIEPRQLLRGQKRLESLTW